jgi:23S rRNA G2445 N2-methylase RlmL
MTGAERPRRAAESFSLDALRDPAFTPRRAELSTLVEIVATGEDKTSRAAAHAIGRIQSPVAERVAAALEGRDTSERVRIVDALRILVGRGEDELIFSTLSRAAADPEPRVRKAAVRGLAKIGGEPARRAIEAAGAGETDPSATRAFDRAKGRFARDADRAEPSTIDPDATLSSASPVVFRCRRGLEPLLRGELEERLGLSEATESPGAVEVMARAPLRELLTVRLALDVAFVVRARGERAADPAAAAADLLASKAARSIVERFTRGPVRYRLAWASGGKKRGVTAAVVKRVADLTEGALLDDPRAASWDVLANDDGTVIELAPRAEDLRFAYRRADVPAASHPTLAAALARAGGVRPNDVVWDPFVGSGLELCERALLGPYARLIGTDVDARAVERARQNLESAGASRFDLRTVDARRAALEGVTLVVTNPPMGRRLVRGSALDELLAETAWQAAGALVPGGRVVLLSPRPRVTREAFSSAGVHLEREREVDLGGFEAVLQRFEKPVTAGRRGGSRART